MPDYLIKRDGHFYYFRRVPSHVSEYDTRKHIKISLKTKDESVARRRALIHNETIEKFWRELMSSTSPASGQDALFRKAVATARSHGFAYRNITDLADNAELGEIVDRMLAIRKAEQGDTEDSKKEDVREALTGSIDVPQVLLSDAFDVYVPKCADRLQGKTDNQLRKWTNPRKLALRNFIDVAGDKTVTDVTRKDILAFQDWWLQRIAEENLKPGSANKNFRHLKDILDTVYLACGLELPIEIENLFSKIMLSGGDGSRESFEAAYVQDVLLNSNALNGLNPESRGIIYMMADTGARLVEITGLMPEDIRLDTDIPHIHIRSNERYRIKTPQSNRQIPLVGAALQGARQFPDGFSRFATADSASSSINKYFRDNDLCPSDGHSLYSLRHTFKDRLRDIQAPEEIIDNLMGHKARGPKYGRGHILETKLEWVKKIAFKVENSRT